MEADSISVSCWYHLPGSANFPGENENGSLRQHNLVDKYVLLIHPLVLGTGRRLFPDGRGFTALRLVSARTTDNGVVIAVYQPVAE